MTKKSRLLSIVLLFKKWHMYMYITMLTKYSALKGIWAGPPRSEGAQNLNNGQSLALETCVRSRI